MFNVTKQKNTHSGEFMPEQILELEIHVLDKGRVILVYPSAPEVGEMIEEIGQSEFDFTPYCG